MTIPARTPVSLRHRLLSAGIVIESRQVVQPGKVMWCHGRKVLGFADLADIEAGGLLRNDADTLCLSPADYEREVRR